MESSNTKPYNILLVIVFQIVKEDARGLLGACLPVVASLLAPAPDRVRQYSSFELPLLVAYFRTQRLAMLMKKASAPRTDAAFLILKLPYTNKVRGSSSLSASVDVPE
jgi:hypothetical protein